MRVLWATPMLFSHNRIWALAVVPRHFVPEAVAKNYLEHNDEFPTLIGVVCVLQDGIFQPRWERATIPPGVQHAIDFRHDRT